MSAEDSVAKQPKETAELVALIVAMAVESLREIYGDPITAITNLTTKFNELIAKIDKGPASSDKPDGLATAIANLTEKVEELPDRLKSVADETTKKPDPAIAALTAEVRALAVTIGQQSRQPDAGAVAALREEIKALAASITGLPKILADRVTNASKPANQPQETVSDLKTFMAEIRAEVRDIVADALKFLTPASPPDASPDAPSVPPVSPAPGGNGHAAAGNINWTGDMIKKVKSGQKLGLAEVQIARNVNSVAGQRVTEDDVRVFIEAQGAAAPPPRIGIAASTNGTSRRTALSAARR